MTHPIRRVVYHRALRRALCRLGVHRWQVLYEPPHLTTTGAYRKALFCVHCGREAPWGPGQVHGPGGPS